MNIDDETSQNNSDFNGDDIKEFVKCIDYCDLVFGLDKYCEDMSVYEMKVHALMSLSSKRLHEAKRWADRALRIDSESQILGLLDFLK
jgi:hypothetical protein